MKSKQPYVRGLILEVPFSDKEQAKELGAWWDPELKKWFVPKGRDPRPFERWIPNGGFKDKEPNLY